jgi:hypothetical protein
VHAGVWETIADALLWVQLCWVFSGFILMAYLAFKVFPNPEKCGHPDMIGSYRSGSGTLHDAESNPSNQLMSSLNCGMQGSQERGIPSKVIEFRSRISEQNRRQG